MKQHIHPTYGYVVFRDQSANTMMLTRSTLAAKADSLPTVRWNDGKEYPLVNVEVSSASHPFYTGKNIVLDAAGQVQKFNQRYRRSSPQRDGSES
ncbi:type B 50S ribosomal protein L31 [Bifidobacterium sp.]|jgi:large subunit ribosomal protein L31|uniref:type B 50S ribosomal protein L31 n=1 Tax=Bifidobacterium sp. TaxID=41200 RepID=UPI0025B96339|nr:type B 50S ribosomal protein L31 [Bifidobacterium sp.]MCI1635472.1 type B 50S ribosomal protein L31 [Bifidobacterium sp.]